MADTQIDELRLDITVEDKTSGESSDKKVKNLATAISRLNKNLQAFDNAKFTKVFDNMSKGLDPFVKKIESVSSALASLATIVSKGGLDKAVKEVTGKVTELKTETTSDSGRKSEPTQAQQGTAQQLGEIQDKAKKATKEINKLNNELNKTEKSSSKSNSSLGKLIKSFGRIAMYRAIRTVIKEIAQAFTESIDGIAKYNKEFRSTMTNLQSSFSKVKTSMGVAFYQVLILLEPLITKIANGIVNFANSLSKVIANMRGVSNYTKINTEYMKEYQSAIQGTLLSFDTFTTLSSNQQIDYSKMFTEANNALDTNQFNEVEKTLKTLMQTLSELWEIIKTIYEALEPFLIKVINELLPQLVDLLKQSSNTTDSLLNIFNGVLNEAIGLINTIVQQMAGAIEIISGLLKLLTGDFDGAWKAIGNGFANMINGIVNMFISFLNIFADIIGVIGKIFGQNWEIPDIEWRMNWKPYADGGMMNRNTFSGAGTMYAIAGESGAEVVAQGSAGTGVLNVEQFADAMVSALVRYGAARDTNNGTTIMLDGNKVGQLVASNVGFRNEANRRNPSLNWK